MKNWADYKHAVNSGNSHEDNPEPSLCRKYKGQETGHGTTQRRTQKVCPRCKTLKLISKFYTTNNRYGSCTSWCKKCLRDYYSQKKPNPIIPGVYKCKFCGTEKSHTEFPREKLGKYGLALSKCKVCKCIYSREQSLGVSNDDYWNMYHKQKGKCGICGCRIHANRYRKFCVDHNHATGEIRGLLCNSCNLALGGFRDDPVVLKCAIKWVEGTVQAIG